MDKEKESEKKFDWGYLLVELIFTNEETEEKFWKLADKRGFLDLFNGRIQEEGDFYESIYYFKLFARWDDFLNKVLILREILNEFKKSKKHGYKIKVKFELEKVFENEKRKWSEIVLKGNSLKKLYSIL